MADLAIRRGDRSMQPALTRELDPYRMFRDLMRWDPFAEMAPAWPEMPLSFSPAFEVKETKDAYVFKADLPGFKEQDLDVTCTGNRLSISGKREAEREEKSETYYACERQFGSFSRSFTLPEGANMDQVHADLKAGVLTIAIPKMPAVQAKKIAVSSAEKSIKS